MAPFFADKSTQDRDNARMNSPRTGLRVASIIFALFALGHLLRLIKHAQVMIGSHHIAMWLSVAVVIIFAGLSFWMWRLSDSKAIT